MAISQAAPFLKPLRLESGDLGSPVQSGALAADKAANEPGRRGSIFFLIRSLNRGGAERQLICIASGLHDLGHEVTVGVYYKGVLDAELRAKGVTVLDLGKRGRLDLVRFSRRLVGAIRKVRPDTVYSFLGSSNILAGLIRPFVPPMKFVWSVRASNMDVSAYDWLSRFSYPVERALAGRADLIISNSHAGVECASSRGFPRERMVVVPNGIDTERFKPDPDARRRVRERWGVGDDEILVGVLARLDPMKDHPTFLRAAALAAQRRADLRFICIGEGPERYARELHALAAGLGIDDRVIWPGQDHEPAEALNGLDLCCSSSAWGEGFSNSVAEAMSCGVSCVVTDVGDSAEVVGETGRVVPPRDPESLCEAMLESIESPGRRGTDPRARVIERFSLASLILKTARALGFAAPAGEGMIVKQEIAERQGRPGKIGSDMSDSVVPHEIEWTPERVKRFWDFYSSNPAMADSYFARMVGPSLLSYVGKRIKIGTAVDIGCGPGDLIGLLTQRGHDAYGVDSSPASIAQVEERFAGTPHFKGTAMNDGTIDLPDGTADTAFMVEVVEHMDDEALGGALSEAKRILRPGGHLVLTTPNEENLDASRTMCPECGGIYHRIQHVRSWSSRTLSDYVARFGFDSVSCRGTVLSPYSGPLGLLYKTAYPMVRGRKPHLIYIGRKTG